MPYRSAILFLVLFVLQSTAEVAHADREKVRIGVITPLTGGMATIGVAVKNGIELARAERPELFGSVEFLYEDDALDAKRDVAAYRKLTGVDHVSIVFGFGGILGNSIGPLADRDRVPLINFNFEAAAAVDRPFVIRSFNHTRQYMNAFAKHLKREGRSKFPFIRTEISFFESMANDLDAAMGRGALEPAGTFNPGDTDFRANLLKLRSTSAGPVGLFLLPEQLVDFLKQASDVGFKRTYFGTDLFETAARIAPDPKLFDGCLYPDNEASADFRARYRAKFGDEAQMTFGGSGYDMAVLTGELLRKLKKFDPEEFLGSFETVTRRVGVLGEFTYRNDPVFGKFIEYPIRVKRISGGKGIPVDR